MRKLIFTILILFLFPVMAFAVDETLAWNPNTTDADFAGFRLHYGNSSGSYDTAIDVGNQTTYTVTGLTEDSVYYYALTAYDEFNNESGYSSEVFRRADGTSPIIPDGLNIITKALNLTITVNPAP